MCLDQFAAGPKQRHRAQDLQGSGPLAEEAGAEITLVAAPNP